MQVLSINSDQHWAVNDLQTGDCVQLSVSLHRKSLEDGIVLVDQVSEKIGGNEAEAMRSWKEDAAWKWHCDVLIAQKFFQLVGNTETKSKIGS